MEQATDNIAWHTDAVVLDRDVYEVALCCCRDIDHTTLVTILDGVVDEIPKYFADTAAVGSDSW
ncbi:hypothetical protein D3C72_1857320 [compost metagenome]